MTGSDWVLCPSCQGHGVVIADETSPSIFEDCTLCNGGCLIRRVRLPSQTSTG